MSLPASRLPSRWFVRPVILGIAAFLMLLAATGFLGIQDWHEWQAASRSLEHSRQVIETLDRVRAYIAELETERRNYLLTLDPAYLNPYGASEEGVRRETQALQNSGGGRSIAEPSCRTSGADRCGKAARDGRDTSRRPARPGWTLGWR